MKKISILSLIIFISAIILAFSVDKSNYSDKNSKLDPIHVTVTGCEDCNNLSYCLNGGSIVYPQTGSCEFDISCDPFGSTTQTICIMCGDKKGKESFYCPTTFKITIPVNESTECDCSGKKKK